MGILLYTEGSVLDTRQTTGTILRSGGGWQPFQLEQALPHNGSWYDNFLSKEAAENSSGWAEKSTGFPGLRKQNSLNGSGQEGSVEKRS